VIKTRASRSIIVWKEGSFGLAPAVANLPPVMGSRDVGAPLDFSAPNQTGHGFSKGTSSGMSVVLSV
jgi:hypothetical protein